MPFDRDAMCKPFSDPARYDGSKAEPPYGKDELLCPFCGEKDFDLIGLANHLRRGWCEAFNSTPTE